MVGINSKVTEVKCPMPSKVLPLLEDCLGLISSPSNWNQGRKNYWYLICCRWLLTKGGWGQKSQKIVDVLNWWSLIVCKFYRNKKNLRNLFQPIVLAQTISWRRGYSIMVDCSGVLQKFNGNDNVFLSFLPLSPFYNLPRNTILHCST